MTVRPIIFSGPMVRALFDGRKTQTRRLATSPLKHVAIGDQLYVREAFSFVGNVDPGWLLHRAHYQQCCDQHGFDKPYPPESDVKWKPSIHMPRTASRFTLTVTDVRKQRVQDISRDDAKAEGLLLHKTYSSGVEGWTIEGCTVPNGNIGIGHPEEIFAWLWDSLHDKTGERWDDNPAIIALSFDVTMANVDQL